MKKVILSSNEQSLLTKFIETAHEQGYKGIRLFNQNFKIEQIQVQATRIRTVLVNVNV